MRSKFPPLNELGLLAQLVEQVTLNHRVGGSSPSQPTYVGKSEFYVQTLDVDQTLEYWIYLPTIKSFEAVWVVRENRILVLAPQI